MVPRDGSFPPPMRARTFPRHLVVPTLLALAAVLLLLALRSHVAARALPTSPSSSASVTALSIAPIAPLAVGTTRIEGWVVDAQKRALPGAQVCASPTSTTGLTDLDAGPFCTTVGEDGRFTLDALRAGRWDVAATAIGFLPAKAFGDTKTPWVDVDAVQGHAPIEIVLARGGAAVAGRVEDPLGRPVAGALITASPTTQSPSIFPAVLARSDAAGAFTVWVPEGVLVIEASAKGWSSGDASAIAPSAKVVVRLGWESVVVGRVVDASTQAAVEGALVAVSGVDTADEVKVRSGADGAFRAEGLAHGRHVVTATAPGRRGVSPSFLISPGETSDEIVVQVQRAPRVFGRVVVAGSGAPCSDGEVDLSDPVSDTLLVAVTDASGVVRFDAVPSGSWELKVTCAGRDGSGAPKQLVVGDADVLDALFPVAEAITIRGVVVDASGAPIAGATVYGRPARVEEPESPTATTGADGSFALAPVKAGDWTLDVSHASFADGSAKASVGSSDVSSVRVVLARGSTLFGRVVDESGAPVAGLDVSFDSTSKSTLTYDDGTYRLIGLSEGAGLLRVGRDGSWLKIVKPAVVHGDDGVPSGVHLDVDGIATQKIDLVVEREAFTLAGRVVDEAGAPVVEATVAIGRDADGDLRSGSSWATVVTDGDGRFRVPNVPRGPWSLRAHRKGAGEGIVRGAPVDVPVTVVVSRGGAIRGTLVLASGAAPARASLRIQCDETQLSRTEEVLGATFVVDELPADTCTVRALANEGVAVAKTVVASGATASIALALEPWGAVAGTVSSVDAVPTSARVYATCDDCVPYEGRSAPLLAGAFRLDRLTPGRWHLELRSADDLEGGADVTVMAGAVASATLNAERPPKAAQVDPQEAPTEPPDEHPLAIEPPAPEMPSPAEEPAAGDEDAA